MPSLFKLHLSRYVDAAGKRVGKGTPGARMVRERSRKWYGEYKDAKGITRRVPLSRDKTAAQSLLNDLVQKAERRSAGLFDPYEEHAKRTIGAHVDEYETFLYAKGNSNQHVSQTVVRIRRLVHGCGFKRLSEIDATKVATWMAEQRATADRFSAQTSNFYLDSLKYFCNWLVTHERLSSNPVASLKRVTIETDRRHDRRSIGEEEFQRLIAAAEQGPEIEGMAGRDRAMLYLLAAWTGYRRRELASLTIESLDLTGQTPSAKVRAAYSKRRREDVVPLHPYLVQRLKQWLATPPQGAMAEPLFALKTKKGHFRKTSKMMRKDLELAREQWIKEGKSEAECARRAASGFLKYEDEDGLFADFHANRHSFVSNLARAGVPLTTAQKLARHSDPRLTANRYTHLEMKERAEAISSLPAPQLTSESHQGAVPSNQHVDNESNSLVAGPVAGTNAAVSPLMSLPDANSEGTDQSGTARNSLNDKTLGNECRQESVPVSVHPAGFEPATFGSVGPYSESLLDLQNSHIF